MNRSLLLFVGFVVLSCSFRAHAFPAYDYIVPADATFTNSTAAAEASAGNDKCPGSNSFVHASCQLSVTFTNSCDEVKAEVAARAKGSQDGSWTDPHNKGVYTIKSNSGSVTDL